MRKSLSQLSHNTVSLLALGVLIFLRVPMLAGIATFWQPAQNAALIIYYPATYLVTAFLIWWERERLRDFWFDLAAGVVFLCQLLLFPFGIGLFIAMRRAKARFPAPPSGLLRWMLIGGLLAILADVFTMQLGLYPSQPRSENPAGLGILFSSVVIQMVNAAVMEEPLFRGFLWGHLRLLGWKNVWIWLFQALLFTFAHSYYLQVEAFPVFFVRMMIPALLMGLIAWRARSIAASMVTHGFLNAAGDILMHSASLEQALHVAWLGAGILAAGLILVVGFEIFRRGRPVMIAEQ